MKEIAVGLALMWLVVFLTGRSFEVKGLVSILFMGFLAWGLGLILFGILGAFA